MWKNRDTCEAYKIGREPPRTELRGGQKIEPEVHIIEKYFQEVQHCFTMTNIRLKGNKEIDLLAINTIRGEYYHVESCVSTTSKLRLKATCNKDGTYNRNGIDYFLREKFGHYRVEEYTRWVFNNKPYHKVLVVWDTQEDFKEFTKKVKDGCGIEIWLMKGIIYDLSNHKTTSGSRDDILRTMELVFLEKKWEKELDKIRGQTWAIFSF